MPEKKVIAVIGATGLQGGGLVRAILNDKSGVAARAVTRNVNSDKAKELSKLGAEVVVADLDDVESLKRAFRGRTARFALPTFGNTSRLRRSLLRGLILRRRPR